MKRARLETYLGILYQTLDEIYMSHLDDQSVKKMHGEISNAMLTIEKCASKEDLTNSDLSKILGIQFGEPFFFAKYDVSPYENIWGHLTEKTKLESWKKALDEIHSTALRLRGITKPAPVTTSQQTDDEKYERPITERTTPQDMDMDTHPYQQQPLTTHPQQTRHDPKSIPLHSHDTDADADTDTEPHQLVDLVGTTHGPDQHHLRYGSNGTDKMPYLEDYSVPLYVTILLVLFKTLKRTLILTACVLITYSVVFQYLVQAAFWIQLGSLSSIIAMTTVGIGLVLLLIVGVTTWRYNKARKKRARRASAMESSGMGPQIRTDEETLLLEIPVISWCFQKVFCSVDRIESDDEDYQVSISLIKSPMVLGLLLLAGGLTMTMINPANGTLSVHNLISFFAHLALTAHVIIPMTLIVLGGVLIVMALALLRHYCLHRHEVVYYAETVDPMTPEPRSMASPMREQPTVHHRKKSSGDVSLQHGSDRADRHSSIGPEVSSTTSKHDSTSRLFSHHNDAYDDRRASSKVVDPSKLPQTQQKLFSQRAYDPSQHDTERSETSAWKRRYLCCGGDSSGD